MSPARVVEALDEVEDGHLGLRLGPESAAVQELALEGTITLTRSTGAQE